MGLFKKKSKSDENEAYVHALLKEDDRYEKYCEQAKELPLLTDDELKIFALTGEQTVISQPNLGPTWLASYNTQFLIRLRRTVLSKLPDETVDEVPNE